MTEKLHHDRLGTIFHHLHKALVELEQHLREERARLPRIKETVPKKRKVRRG